MKKNHLAQAIDRHLDETQALNKIYAAEREYKDTPGDHIATSLTVHEVRSIAEGKRIDYRIMQRHRAEVAFLEEQLGAKLVAELAEARERYIKENT